MPSATIVQTTSVSTSPGASNPVALNSVEAKTMLLQGGSVSMDIVQAEGG
jgi:hypothetical protein